MITDKICLLNDDEMGLIKVSVLVHINQCERYKGTVNDKEEYDLISNKIEKMKKIVEKF